MFNFPLLSILFQWEGNWQEVTCVTLFHVINICEANFQEHLEWREQKRTM